MTTEALLARLADLEARVAALEARPKPGPKKHTPPPRTCIVCGDAFTRNPDESVRAYQKRKTCGGECRRELHHRTLKARHPVETRHCAVCGAEIPRGKHEPPSQYKARKTCGAACRDKLRVDGIRLALIAKREREADRARQAKVKNMTRDERRMWALHIVRQSGHVPMTAWDVAHDLGVTEPTARGLLLELEERRLLASRDGSDGRVWYDAAAMKAAA